MYFDALGNAYEDLPGVVEDTEARIVRLTFDETVTTTTPVTIPICAMPDTGIGVHETQIRADITQTSAGTCEFQVGTDDDPDAFAALTDKTNAFVCGSVGSESANQSLFTENDVAGAMHEVIQLVLTEDSGGSDNSCRVQGEVRILFSGRPAARNMRTSKNIIVASPDAP